MYCSKCGAEIDPSDKFCSKCGAPNIGYQPSENAGSSRSDRFADSAQANDQTARHQTWIFFLAASVATLVVYLISLFLPYVTLSASFFGFEYAETGTYFQTVSLSLVIFTILFFIVTLILVIARKNQAALGFLAGMLVLWVISLIYTNGMINGIDLSSGLTDAELEFFGIDFTALLTRHFNAGLWISLAMILLCGIFTACGIPYLPKKDQDQKESGEEAEAE